LTLTEEAISFEGAQTVTVGKDTKKHGKKLD